MVGDELPVTTEEYAQAIFQSIKVSGTPNMEVQRVIAKLSQIETETVENEDFLVGLVIYAKLVLKDIENAKIQSR